jgi:predicted DCC family thiol-disulfide oxidoreductase YuxK
VSGAKGWVLYDADCGFCSRWVPFWEKTLRRQGLGIAPLQADWLRVRLGVDRDRLLDDLRLIFEDGRQLAGADVYRYVMRRIWWALPAYLLSIAPVFRSIFDGAYRAFAVNRYRVSRSCRLEKS